MNLTDKLRGFPSVNYINLHDCPERRAFMETQFEKFGIRSRAYQTDRYVNFKDSVKVNVIGANYELPDIQIGAMISNIENMRWWYENTNEPYAIFCDDDISFDSINHWNFSWTEFVGNLPVDWVCLQLIRMYDDLSPAVLADMDLRLKFGRWWGAAFMFRREYVGHLLKILIAEDGSYNLSSNGGQFQPCVENILTINWCMVYNFPLVTENNETLAPTVPREPKYPWEEKMRDARRVCNTIYDHYWKYCTTDLDIRKALEIS